MAFYNKRGRAVRIFISWSGERSLRIAKALKEWIKDVIQSVEPFVSSEDIQKGARWSVDIAKELQESDFGVLCVTRDNFEAPWLLFEAGALSKAIEKSRVVPFLFDLNPSDLSNSPLMQFQAAPFSKDEIRKLINTINERVEKKLDGLDKVFEKWYPDLEAALEEITSSIIEDDEDAKTIGAEKSSQVLEEILSLSRDNQKLLRNSESKTTEELGEVSKKLERISNRTSRNEGYSRRQRPFNPLMIREIFYIETGEKDENCTLLVATSLLKEDFPWIYDFGKDLFNLLRSNKSDKLKDEAIRDFMNMLEYTSRIAKEYGIGKKDDDLLLSGLSMILMETLERMDHSLIYSSKNASR